MFQVHKVHKYTYFEKLLANVEATFTFVQASPILNEWFGLILAPILRLLK